MRRPGEISVAAAVAFLGSGLVLLYGLSAATIYGPMLQSVHQKYPGQDFKTIADTIIPGLQTMLVCTMYVSVSLGILGFITAFGLLRMKRWARIFTIAWCIVSTLGCLLALTYLRPKAGFLFHPRAILTLMLFLFPINAWWLMLFLRPEIKAEFGDASVSERNDLDRNERWTKLARPRYPGDFGK